MSVYLVYAEFSGFGLKSVGLQTLAKALFYL